MPSVSCFSASAVTQGFQNLQKASRTGNGDASIMCMFVMGSMLLCQPGSSSAELLHMIDMCDATHLVGSMLCDVHTTYLLHVIGMCVVLSSAMQLCTLHPLLRLQASAAAMRTRKYASPLQMPWCASARWTSGHRCVMETTSCVTSCLLIVDCVLTAC